MYFNDVFPFFKISGTNGPFIAPDLAKGCVIVKQFVSLATY